MTILVRDKKTVKSTKKKCHLKVNLRLLRAKIAAHGNFSTQLKEFHNLLTHLKCLKPVQVE